MVSISDLMSGLLFLFIITVSVFSLTLQDQQNAYEQKAIAKQAEIDKLTKTKQARITLLQLVSEKLMAQNIHVAIDPANGILHLPEALLFESGSDRLNARGFSALEKIAEVLKQILPCYCNGACSNSRRQSVNPFEAGLDAVFIEGHTDDRPLRSTAVFKSNWELSTARAIRTFKVLGDVAPELMRLQNRAGERIFGVSGYADSRPVKPNISEDNRAQNRRIDIRFIMAMPGNEVDQRAG